MKTEIFRVVKLPPPLYLQVSSLVIHYIRYGTPKKEHQLQELQGLPFKELETALTTDCLVLTM